MAAIGPDNRSNSPSQFVKRRYRIPPPSNRPLRNDAVPLVISPSAPCSAQPVVVPRSSASNVRSARKAGGRSGIASCIAVARVRSAMGGLLFWLAARVEDDGGLVLGGTGPLSSDWEGS